MTGRRAAIYARISTDKQSETSPDDQVARCREFADEHGWVVAGLTVTESGVSGASRHNRAGLLDLIKRISEWDVLIAFDFSRLARNQEDLGWIRNRLRPHPKTAFEASTGLDLENVGSQVMGVINEQYLAKLRADTHRGLRGRVERKMSAGGAATGAEQRRSEVPRSAAASYESGAPTWKVAYSGPSTLSFWFLTTSPTWSTALWTSPARYSKDATQTFRGNKTAWGN